jgi:hypothetical protein
MDLHYPKHVLRGYGSWSLCKQLWVLLHGAMVPRTKFMYSKEAIIGYYMLNVDLKNWFGQIAHTKSHFNSKIKHI